MDANYFSHDSNARNDSKMINVRARFGAEGYGVYFMILERLRDEATYTSITDYNMLAFDLHVDTSVVKSVIEDFGLFVFTNDGKYFSSESFNKRMALKDAKSNARSEAGKKGANKRWDSNAKDKNGKAIAKSSKNIASKEKESKVNKSKGNSLINNAPARNLPPIPLNKWSKPKEA